MIDIIDNLMKYAAERITISEILKRIYLFQVDMTIDPHLPWELDYAMMFLKGHGPLRTCRKCRMLGKIMHAFTLS